MILDIQSNRKSVKWTRKEQAMRVLWAFAKPFFSLSPRPFWGWRVTLLKMFGAKVGKDVRVDRCAQIEIPWHLCLEDGVGIGRGAKLYSLGSIRIGKNATISQYSHLCAGTHDYRDPTLPLLKLPIMIEDSVWVCADAFVGPNVKVGQGAIVAARAVVIKDVPEWTIVAGNPAQFVKERKLNA